MQSKEELEGWYANRDPWRYETNPDDELRLKKILNILGWGKKVYEKALDIGCGEGFITRHLPANRIYGYDIANNATDRLPTSVIPITAIEGKYDLVISTGTLYQQYDHEAVYQAIKRSASQYILIGGIRDWLIPKDFGKQIQFSEFPYRGYIQRLTLYEF